MSQPMGGYVGSAHDGSRATMCAKERERMLARGEEQRRELAQQTAAYRLKGTDEKFAAASTAADGALQRATVGLVSKEEFARRRMAIEAAEAGAAPDSGEGGASGASEGGGESSKEKKKKKKKKDPNGGALSFAFDEDDGEAAEPVAKKKAKTHPAGEEKA
jgi:hypothetical protein